MPLPGLRYVVTFAGMIRDDLQELSLYARATALGAADMLRRMTFVRRDTQENLCPSEMQALQRYRLLSKEELEEKITQRQLSQELNNSTYEGEIIILQMHTNKPEVTDAIHTAEEYLATVRLLSYDDEHYALIANLFRHTILTIAGLNDQHSKPSDEQLKSMHVLLYNMLRNRYYVFDNLIRDTRVRAHYHLNESIQMLLLMQNIVHTRDRGVSMLNMRELYVKYTHSGDKLRMRYYTPNEQTDIVAQLQQLSGDDVLVHRDTVRATQILLAIAVRKDVQQIAHLELSFAREKHIKYMISQARKYTTFSEPDELATLPCQLMYTRLAQVLQICYTHGALVCYGDYTLFHGAIDDEERERNTLAVILNIIKYSNDIMFDIARQLVVYMRASAVIYFMNNRTAITLRRAPEISRAMQQKDIRKHIVSQTVEVVLTDNIVQTVQQHLYDQDADIQQSLLCDVVQQIFSFTHAGIHRNSAIKSYIQNTLNDALLNLRHDMVFMRYAQDVANKVVNICQSNGNHDLSAEHSMSKTPTLDTEGEGLEMRISHSKHNLDLIAGLFGAYDKTLSIDEMTNRLLDSMSTHQDIELYLRSLDDASDMLQFNSHLMHLLIQDIIHRICACAKDNLISSGSLFTKHMLRHLVNAASVYGTYYTFCSIYALYIDMMNNAEDA